MRNHVQNAADDLTAPAEITPAMIAAGAREYKTMCAHCHGGIGASRAGWAETMRPKPPALAHAAQGWSLEEVNWIVDHGIKMSGMPAFGGKHEEATICITAAFVKALTEMSEEQYARYYAVHGEEEGRHSYHQDIHASKEERRVGKEWVRQGRTWRT